MGSSWFSYEQKLNFNVNTIQPNIKFYTPVTLDAVCGTASKEEASYLPRCSVSITEQAV